MPRPRWLQPSRLAVLTTLAIAGLAAVPALAAPVVVGYLPPQVDYGLLTGGDGGGDGQLADGEIRAQGLVVANLEPGSEASGGNGDCPDDGCAYQLIVADPEAIAAGDPDATTGTGACDTTRYAVIDPSPQVRDVDGARLHTGRGALPTRLAHPVDGDNATEAGQPPPLSRGVGQLCFATPTDAGEAPTATTQPVPIVVLSNGAPPAGS